MSESSAPDAQKPGLAGNARPIAKTARRLSISEALASEARFGHGFLWFPVAMMLGIVVWFGAGTDLPVWLLATGLIGAGLGAYSTTRGSATYFGLLLLSGALLGMLSASLQTQRVSATLLDGPVTTRISGLVVDRDVDDRGRWRYTIELQSTENPTIGRPPDRVRVLARSSHTPIEIGQAIGGLARLQPPSGPALPGGYDFAFNAYFAGLGAYGFFYGPPEESDEIKGSDRWFLLPALNRFRARISEKLREALPGDTGAFASALAVADRRGMRAKTVESLRASGLAHVLAISGLHMALVAGTVFFLIRGLASFFPNFVQAFPVKKMAAVFALVVATAYLLISGASVSTQRAWLMLAIVMIAVMADRPALTLRNVALAAIVIMLIQPSAVLGPGFQMSFAATAALIAAYGGWRDRQAGSPNIASDRGTGFFSLMLVFFIGLAVTSIVAGLATAPFSSFHFHRVASLGLIANLVAMPIMTFIVMPFGLLSLSLMPFGLENLTLPIVGLGLEGVLAVARFVENLGGFVVTGRMPLPVFVALCLDCLFWC